jgi:hypothetical protein
MKHGLLAIALLFGCATPSALDTQLRALRTVVHDARARGAYTCAPEELATAEAHLTFAANELEQGDPRRAREHLILARANAAAAGRLSEGEACRKARASAVAPHSGRSVARMRAGHPARAAENTAQPPLRRWSSRDNAAI